MKNSLSQGLDVMDGREDAFTKHFVCTDKTHAVVFYSTITEQQARCAAIAKEEVKKQFLETKTKTQVTLIDELLEFMQNNPIRGFGPYIAEVPQNIMAKLLEIRRSLIDPDFTLPEPSQILPDSQPSDKRNP